MKNLLCYTIADKGCVCINGVCVPCGGDGLKKIVLTTEIEKNYSNPWIDLRESNLEIWDYDCNAHKPYKYTKQDLGTWGVEICASPADDTIYLIKY